jgi:iron complex transport system ATP-binding protein
LLKVTNASLSIGNKKLLNGVNISIEASEFIAICGPNGAGKSSLFKLLSGELTPNQGAVHLHQIKLTDWKPRQLARHRALLQQHCEVGFDYTAKEVVLLGRYPHHQGNIQAYDKTIAEMAMHEMDIGHLANQVYSTLSGGERARTHMARVLAQIWDPATRCKLLLLDEPIASLDVLHQHKTLQLAKQWTRTRKTTVIAIVHDFNLASQYADRIALLHKGEIKIFDSPDVVMQPEHIKSCFDVDCIMMSHPDDGSPVICNRRVSA